jgi:hypothetical protein
VRQIIKEVYPKHRYPCTLIYAAYMHKGKTNICMYKANLKINFKKIFQTTIIFNPFRGLAFCINFSYPGVAPMAMVVKTLSGFAIRNKFAVCITYHEVVKLA